MEQFHLKTQHKEAKHQLFEDEIPAAVVWDLDEESKLFHFSSSLGMFDRNREQKEKMNLNESIEIWFEMLDCVVKMGLLNQRREFFKRSFMILAFGYHFLVKIYHIWLEEGEDRKDHVSMFSKFYSTILFHISHLLSKMKQVELGAIACHFTLSTLLYATTIQQGSERKEEEEKKEEDERKTISTILFPPKLLIRPSNSAFSLKSNMEVF